MKKLIDLCLGAAGRLPGSASPSSNVVVLLYHGTPRRGDGYGIGGAVFEEHLRFLQRNFELVAPERFEVGRTRTGRDRVLLTFDDGFRNNAEVAAPLLRKYGMPALFFISSGHCEPGRVLWFAYLQALRKFYRHGDLTFRGERMDMSADKRDRTIKTLRDRLLELRPHPAAMIRAIDEELPRAEDFVPADILADSFSGMTPEQVGELAADPLFSVGVHTVDHPHLTKCDEGEAFRQIRDNKAWIEGTCGKPVRDIAYPSGDYDPTTLRQCREQGIRTGYAVIPRERADDHLEVPRLGIYGPSLDALGFKIRWGHKLRSMGLKLG